MLSGSGCRGCSESEPPPGMPGATDPAPSGPPTVDLTVPDAGDVVDAGDGGDAGARPSTGGGGVSLARCCAALSQNAKSAVPPQNAMLESAATYCSASVSASSPSQRAAVLSTLKTMAGGSLPGGCT
jgi:hypothetical protein